MRNLLITVFAFFAALHTTAQTATENFAIALPTEKIPNSLYKTVRLVDVRSEPENLGIVQVGTFNRKARVVAETPLAGQLSNVMNALTDNTAQTGELFLLLRQFSFAEVIGAMSERGYFHFRAVLFAKRGEGFQKLDAVDTVMVIRAMDATKGLLRQGSKALTELLSANLTRAPVDGITYTSTEVIHFDEMEKRAWALYTAAELKNGIYKSFHSFASQLPDEEAFTVAFTKDNRPSALKIQNAKGKMEKLSPKEVYAFVHEGQPFIATEYGYYSLSKRENDFYFTGKAKVAANSSDVMMASMFFGVIGGLIASSPGSAVFEMKLDHLSGGFIWVKEIRQQQKNNDAVY